MIPGGRPPPLTREGPAFLERRALVVRSPSATQLIVKPRM